MRTEITIQQDYKNIKNGILTNCFNFLMVRLIDKIFLRKTRLFFIKVYRLAFPARINI